MTAEMRQTQRYLEFADECIAVIQKADANLQTGIKLEKMGKQTDTGMVVLAREQMTILQELATRIEREQPPRQLAPLHGQLVDTVKTGVDLALLTGQAFAENDREKQKQREKLQQSYTRKQDAVITALRKTY